MVRFSAILAVSLALAGCVSSGTKVDPDAVASFQRGVTTLSDVEARLGPPTALSTALDGSMVAVYSYAHASTRAATFIPVVGLFAGGADVHGQTVALRFAPDGRYIEASSSVTNAGSHVGL